jgi:hypothetical protein
LGIQIDLNVEGLITGLRAERDDQILSRGH